MTPELKALWLQKLPEYPKTKGHLKDDVGYCCLGVLLETMGYTFDTVNRGETNDPWYEPVPLEPYAYPNSANELSDFGLDQAGLDRALQTELIGVNDENDTWEPVIKYIEYNL